MEKLYLIDLDRLHRDKGQQCRCLIASIENDVLANICPCDAFTTQGKCRCNLFKEYDASTEGREV